MSHSKIGASTCERWWNCPGSVKLVESVPEQPQSPYAAEGTAAHALGEMCLSKGETDAFLYVGQEIEKHEVTEDMAEAVQVYLDTIYGDMKRLKLSPDDLEIEHKFHLPEIHPNAFGTNDANLRRFMKHLIVYDYKHGAGVAVDAEDNKQGLYYALGAAAEGDYETIEIVIIQPRAMHKDGPVRRWSITKAELEEFAVELKSKAEATFNPSAPLCSGAWCHKTFCPALSVCPAARKNLEVAAMASFEQKTLNLPAPESLTPLQLRRLLDAAPLLDAWIKGIEAHALALAMRGEEVVDYKLVRKRSNRKWADESVVAKTLEENNLSGVEIYKKKLIGIGEAEKLFNKKLVDKLTIKPGAGCVLVPVDDPREAVNPTGLEVFKNDDLFS